MRTFTVRWLLVPLLFSALGKAAWAQKPAPTEPPPSAPTPPAPAPSPAPPSPAPSPSPAPAPAPEAVPDAQAETPPEATPEPAAPSGLRIHVITTRNTYVPLAFDIFDVRTQKVVASGRGALEGRGEPPALFELAPGLYKIVRAGEPYETRVDFATVDVQAGQVTDFVIVVEPNTYEFRGAGVVTTELPRGVEIAGVRVNLNAGGTIFVDHKVHPIGTTPGLSAIVGLFGNFGLVYDRGNHFLDVSADLQLNLTDPVTGSIAPTSDRFQASALYAYNLGNPYVGPYVRLGLETGVFPGYLYLESDSPTVNVTINRVDGSSETRTFGGEANPDDLRIRIAEPFAPLLLQEEIGANLKAVDLDLLLFELVVATRLGFGFRQGFTHDLLVLEGDAEGPAVVLNEVDNYDTLGPVVGASADVTFARWLFGSAQFGMMVPLKDTDRAGEGFGERLLIDFSGTAGFKVPILTDLLTASFDYTFRLQRDGYLTDETQFEQTVMGRATVTLF